MASSDFTKHMFKMPDCIAWFHVEVTTPGCKTTPLIIPTCVQVVKRMMGIKLGFCVSGHALYRRLFKYREGKNYKVLQWRVK